MFHIKNHSECPFYNLAFEEYLLKKSAATGESYFTVWRNAPTVVIGRFQNAWAEIDGERARIANINLARRLTGGGAVYHDLNNLNYSFIINHNSSFSRQNRLLAIMASLVKLNLNIEFSGRNDLLINNLKFSGLAQYIGSQSTLLHGALLFDVDLNQLAEILTVNNEKLQAKGVKSVKSRVTNLKPYLPTGFTINDLASHLTSSITGKSLALTPEEHQSIERLKIAKYQSWAWNWGKTPAFTHKKEKRFQWGQVTALFEVEAGLVKSLNIFGDFFGDQPRLIKSALLGQPYNEESLTQALYKLPLSDIFYGAEPREIINFLAG